MLGWCKMRIVCPSSSLCEFYACKACMCIHNSTQILHVLLAIKKFRFCKQEGVVV